VLPGDQLAGRRSGFDDPRLEELLFRYRARNFPDTLDDDERARWQRHCAERLHGGAGGALTLEAFFERIDTLAEEADERSQAILEALYDYAEGIAPEPL
jgi:exodeoxyribonuclease-1